MKPVSAIAHTDRSALAGSLDLFRFESLRFDLQQAEPIPEPGTMLMLASGVAIFCARRLKRSALR